MSPHSLVMPLPHRFTIARSKRTRHKEVGLSLLCCTLPSGRPAWPLASLLSYGVRTFLYRRRFLGRNRNRQRSPDLLHDGESVPQRPVRDEERGATPQLTVEQGISYHLPSQMFSSAALICAICRPIQRRLRIDSTNARKQRSGRRWKIGHPLVVDPAAPFVSWTTSMSSPSQNRQRRRMRPARRSRSVVERGARSACSTCHRPQTGRSRNF